jgi:hypothetical protein
VPDAGRIFIREGTALPRTLQLESEPYMPGWRSVSNLDGYSCKMNRRILDGSQKPGTIH